MRVQQTRAGQKQKQGCRRGRIKTKLADPSAATSEILSC